MTEPEVTAEETAGPVSESVETPISPRELKVLLPRMLIRPET